MNPSNERLRHTYIEHLRDARKLSEKTIDAALRHLSELERFISGKNFERLSKGQSKAFSDHLHVRSSKAAAGTLSSSSIVHTMNDLQAFYAWLTTIKGRKVDPEAVARLTASRRALMDHKSKPDKAPLTPEHLRAMITAIGDKTVLDRRDRALVAFIYLTGMRAKLDTNRQNDLMQSLVRTDLTVREEQEMLMLFRRMPPQTRASVLHILTRA